MTALSVGSTVSFAPQHGQVTTTAPPSSLPIVVSLRDRGPHRPLAYQAYHAQGPRSIAPEPVPGSRLLVAGFRCGLAPEGTRNPEPETVFRLPDPRHSRYKGRGPDAVLPPAQDGEHDEAPAARIVAQGVPPGIPPVPEHGGPSGAGRDRGP